MFTKKSFSIVSALLLVLLISVSTAFASNNNPKALASNDNPKIVAIERLPVELKAMTANVGETVTQELEVPVKIHYEDGRVKDSVEIVIFTLSNQIRERGNLSLAYSPYATTTYLTCSGNLNQAGRNFHSSINWHYNGTSAWTDNSSHYSTSSDPDYNVGVYYDYFPSGPSNTINGIASQVFTYVGWLPWGSNRVHNINWVLTNSGSCTATGSIN